MAVYVKHIPLTHERALRYAVQHFLSVAESKSEESLGMACLAEKTKELLGGVDHAINFAKQIMDSNISLVPLSDLEKRIIDSAIVAWGWELRDVDSDATVKRECDSLISAFDATDWRLV